MKRGTFIKVEEEPRLHADYQRKRTIPLYRDSPVEDLRAANAFHTRLMLTIAG